MELRFCFICSNEFFEVEDLVLVLIVRYRRFLGCWGFTGEAVMVWLVVVLGVGFRVIFLDLLFFVGYDFRFGSSFWVEMS